MTIKINSHNEFDPLRTIMFGNIENSCNIPNEFPCKIRSFNNCNNNIKMSDDKINKANFLRNNLKKILQDTYSVNIIESPKYDHSNNIKTPYWSVTNTNEHSCPRDTFSIIGNTILEASMSWRCRYFESLIFHKPLLDIYNIDTNCKWIQAPKSLMSDNLYNFNYPIELENRKNCNINMLNEQEPVFDAADIVRCGKDLFVQKGFTTNYSGINWLNRQFGNEYRIHTVDLKNNITPTHLDAEFSILRPGLLMTCPDKPLNDDLYNMINNEENDWNIIQAPNPVNNKMVDGCFSSPWLSMNVLSIDENTIIVEEKEKNLIDLLESYSFNVIPVPFFDAYMFGGGFHCQTLDLHRDGYLKSYFPYLDRINQK